MLKLQVKASRKTHVSTVHVKARYPGLLIQEGLSL